MKIFKANLEYGLAFIVANDATEALNLLKDDDLIMGGISIYDITVVEPFVVIGGKPSIIDWYQE